MKKHWVDILYYIISYSLTTSKTGGFCKTLVGEGLPYLLAPRVRLQSVPLVGQSWRSLMMLMYSWVICLTVLDNTLSKGDSQVRN